MAKNIGWIRLYRKIFNNDLWNKEMFSKCQAWIDLLLMAEYEPKTEIKRYQELRIERGEVLITVRELGERWKWSRTKVVNFINALESQKMVTQKVTNVGTIITIENYGIYQDCDEEEKTRKKTTERQPKDSRKLPTSYKESNKNNNKRIFSAPAREGIPPDIDDVKAYIAEKGYSVDAENWYDFYQSKGWYVGKNKMKDWKAAIRTWERNNKPSDSAKHKNHDEIEKLMEKGGITI